MSKGWGKSELDRKIEEQSTEQILQDAATLIAHVPAAPQDYTVTICGREITGFADAGLVSKRPLKFNERYRWRK